MSERGIPVAPEIMAEWAELALKIRTHSLVLRKVSVPDAGSLFSELDEKYPSESISQWCREGLRSALDHLNIWAQHTVPLQQFEGQAVSHEGFRWTYTLMRAGIEGAAQSLYISGASDSLAAVARLVRMVRHDLREQSIAFNALGRDTSTIQRRQSQHAGSAELLAGHEKAAEKLPDMASMVANAATYCGFDPKLYEAHWRICSAAAHGKSWAITELQTFVGESTEWRPGQFHLEGYPDAAKLTAMLTDTLDLVACGVYFYLTRSYLGDSQALVRECMYTAAKATPQRDDGSHLRRVAKTLGVDV